MSSAGFGVEGFVFQEIWFGNQDVNKLEFNSFFFGIYVASNIANIFKILVVVVAAGVVIYLFLYKYLGQTNQKWL